MFYLREFFLRSKYVCFSFFLTLIFFFIYKDFLLLLISFSLLENSTDGNSEVFGKFIFTHPAELLKVQLFVSLIFSFFYSVPYIFWTFLEFFKSSFYMNEHRKIKRLILNILIFFLFANIVINFVLFPNIWSFFANFNATENTNATLHLFFELRVEEYIKFLSDFTYLSNFFLVIFISIVLIIRNFGISTLLKWKRLFILLNIVFATLLSPPDVYSQLIILAFLSLMLEFCILISLYFIKTFKYHYDINKVTY
jgi:sec-independent protein translocase protein TatC